MKNFINSKESYFPQPESGGGWRFFDQNNTNSILDVDFDLLNVAVEEYQHFFDNVASGIVIIKNGYIIKEHYSFMTLPGSRFDVWSCTKSFTGIAWGLLLEESKNGLLPNNAEVKLDSLAYSFLPESFKVTDKLKEKITIGHLLSMTSGIPGEGQSTFGITPKINSGPFEHALGYQESRYGKKQTSLLEIQAQFGIIVIQP